MDDDGREPADAPFDGFGSPRFFRMGPGSVGQPRVHVYKGDVHRVTVGRDVTIGPDVEFIVGGNHRIDWVTTYGIREMAGLPGAFVDNPWSKGDIVVGDDVVIGRGAKVLSGVSIGDRAAVAPYAVVTRDVAAGATVVGHPAEEVGARQDGPVPALRRRRGRGAPGAVDTEARLALGTGTYFPPVVRGDAGQVTIGSYSSIAEECEMVLDPRVLPGDDRRDIVIGSDVWLGRGVKVLAGVSIGDGAVVAAYSVVVDDIAPYAIHAGNPARQVGQRFPVDIASRLLRIKWWEWSPETVRDRAPQLCQDDIASFVAQYDV